jgi:hypothetical protein
LRQALSAGKVGPADIAQFEQMLGMPLESLVKDLSDAQGVPGVPGESKELFEQMLRVKQSTEDL